MSIKYIHVLSWGLWKIFFPNFWWKSIILRYISNSQRTNNLKEKEGWIFFVTTGKKKTKTNHTELQLNRCVKNVLDRPPILWQLTTGDYSVAFFPLKHKIILASQSAWDVKNILENARCFRSRSRSVSFYHFNLHSATALQADFIYAFFSPPPKPSHL